MISEHYIFFGNLYLSNRILFPNGKGIGYDYYVSFFGSALTIITLEKVEDNWAPINSPVIL